MQVKLKVDYRGKATRENFFAAGSLVDVSDADALVLIAQGKAESVIEESVPVVEDEVFESLPEIDQALKPRTSKPKAKK